MELASPHTFLLAVHDRIWDRDQFSRGVLSERPKGKRKSDLNATLGRGGRSKRGMLQGGRELSSLCGAGGGMFQGGAEMRSRTFEIADLLLYQQHFMTAYLDDFDRS